MPFDPAALRVDGRGYLYHPSPSPPTRRNQAKSSPYGPYSLLRSSLVLTKLTDDLDLDLDNSSARYRWRGTTYDIGPLEEHEVVRGTAKEDD
jgi:hypothetical protein